jgi:hypothetical protein
MATQGKQHRSDTKAMTIRPIDRIPGFLTALRNGSPELDIGDAQILTAFELLEQLRRREEIDLEPGQWRNLLAPVLCSSAAQQQAFFEKFEAAFAERSETIDDKRTKKMLTRRDRVAWIYAATIAILVIVGFTVHLKWPNRTKTPYISVDQVKVDPKPSAPPAEVTLTVTDGKAPVKSANVFANGKDYTSDEKGRVTLRGPAFEYSENALVTVPGGRMTPYLLKFPQTNTSVALTAAQPLRLPELRMPWFTRHWVWAEAAILVSPLALLLLWFYRLYRRRRELHRWASAAEPRLRRIGLPSGGELVFQPNDIRRLATTLRRRRPDESMELDAAATVDRTCREGGFFRPVYAKRTSEPEYVFLGERTNLKDQQTRLQDELIGRLRDHDVFVQRYYFHGDPAVCVDSHGTIFALTELSAAHPGHELWLALEAERCLDPASGAPERWTDMLVNWPDRVLLSGSTATRTLDLRVAPPTREGLEALASNAARPNPFRYYPQTLVADPERFVTRAQPGTIDAERLKSELLLFLGPAGYLLLQASAVYPALAWNITLTLAQELVPSSTREVTLYRLVSLPWFRHGTLPDWLRVELLSGLGEKEQEVRAAIVRLLQRADTVAPTAEKGEALDIVPGRPEPALSAEALDDHIYLAFASGRLDKLSVEAPTAWNKFLRDSVTLRVAAGLLSLAVFAFFSSMFLERLAKLSKENTGAQVALQEPADPLVRRVFEIEQQRELTKGSFSDAAGFVNEAGIVEDIYGYPNVWTEELLQKAKKVHPAADAAPGMLAATGKQVRMIKAENKSLGIVMLFGMPQWIRESELTDVYDVSGHLMDGGNISKWADKDAPGALPSPPPIPGVASSPPNSFWVFYTIEEFRKPNYHDWTLSGPEDYDERYQGNKVNTYRTLQQAVIGGCDGRITQKAGEISSQIFIPDRNCPVLMSRFRHNNGRWEDLGLIIPCSNAPCTLPAPALRGLPTPRTANLGKEIRPLELERETRPNLTKGNRVGVVTRDQNAGASAQTSKGSFNTSTSDTDQGSGSKPAPGSSDTSTKVVQLGSGSPSSIGATLRVRSPDGHWFAESLGGTIKTSTASGGDDPVPLMPESTATITSITWSPDSVYLASADTTGTIRIWRSSTRTLSAMVRNSSAVSALAFNPLGTKLAVAFGEGNASVYDVESGKLFQSYETRRIQSSVKSISWDLTGELLTFTYDDGNVIVWNFLGNYIISNSNQKIESAPGKSTQGERLEPGKISVGMTIDQVKAELGLPTKILNVGSKQVFVYKDNKITFINSKVVAVQ